MKGKRRCTIFNYIPHDTPYMKKKDENFEKWYENYKEDLIEMYTKTVSIIKNKNFTDTVIDCDSEKYFNIFIYNIYDASSKYILRS